MSDQNKPSIAWYENTWVVVITCIVFFPVGLYALWKNSTIGLGWKVAVTVFFVWVVNINIQERRRNVLDANPNVSTPANLLSPPASYEEPVSAEKQEVIFKLKKQAKKNWPDDYSTQEYWINKQLEDYDYMLGIENNSIKKRAERDWPLDFSTQKYWYDEQIEAKARLE